jgi:DNA-binding CsgD family transcriptional regulator
VELDRTAHITTVSKIWRFLLTLRSEKGYHITCLINITVELLDNKRGTGPEIAVSHASRALTTREQQILKLVKAGKSSKLIARELYLSLHTVSNHRKNICHKLDCHSVAQLMSSDLRIIGVDNRQIANVAFDKG